MKKKSNTKKSISEQIEDVKLRLDELSVIVGKCWDVKPDELTQYGADGLAIIISLQSVMEQLNYNIRLDGRRGADVAARTLHHYYMQMYDSGLAALDDDEIPGDTTQLRDLSRAIDTFTAYLDLPPFFDPVSMRGFHNPVLHRALAYAA